MSTYETPNPSVSGIHLPPHAVANESHATGDRLLSILSPAQRQRVHSIAQLLKDPARTQIISFKGMNPHTRTELNAAHGMESSMADDCRSIDTPTILLGEDGEIILVYLPDFFTHENVDKTMAAVDSLLAEVQLTSPKKDYRHKGINMADLKDKYGPGKFGTLHCAAWMEQGKSYDGPLISREMQKSQRVNRATCTFIQNLAPVKEELALLYAAIAPNGWRMCSELGTKLETHIPAMKILRTSAIDPWCSHVLVSNLPSTVHRDMSDAVHSLSGLCCCGSFLWSWLVLYTLGIKVRYKPTDGVLLNTFLLPHFVFWAIDDPKQIVTRHSLAFFNHQDVLDWVEKKITDERGNNQT